MTTGVIMEEDVRMLYAYKNGDVSGDDLRREILGGAKVVIV